MNKFEFLKFIYGFIIEVNMDRIYLDTSNIALLTQIRENDLNRFQKFLDEWNYRKYILALSNAHFFEIMRHNSDEERKARFDLIETFIPVRLEQKLSESEIVLASLQKGAIIQKGATIRFFSEKISSPAQFVNYRAFDNPFMRDVYNLNYDAYMTSWNANSDDEKLGSFKKTRFSDVPDDALPAEELKDFFEQLKPIINESTKSFFDKYENLPKELADFGNNFVFEAFESFYERCSEIGTKEAFAEFIEIDSSDIKTQKSFVDKLLNGFNFKMTVETTMREYFPHFDERDIEYVKSKISLENCSGTWLKIQVRNQLLKAKQFDASNELDIYHLSHLPYVSFLFADKRIVEMTKQVFKFKDLPKTFRKIKLPFSIPNSIEELENVLFSK